MSIRIKAAKRSDGCEVLLPVVASLTPYTTVPPAAPFGGTTATTAFDGIGHNVHSPQSRRQVMLADAYLEFAQSSGDTSVMYRKHAPKAAPVELAAFGDSQSSAEFVPRFVFEGLKEFETKESIRTSVTAKLQWADVPGRYAAEFTMEIEFWKRDGEDLLDKEERELLARGFASLPSLYRKDVRGQLSFFNCEQDARKWCGVFVRYAVLRYAAINRGAPMTREELMKCVNLAAKLSTTVIRVENVVFDENAGGFKIQFFHSAPECDDPTMNILKRRQEVAEARVGAMYFIYTFGKSLHREHITFMEDFIAKESANADNPDVERCQWRQQPPDPDKLPQTFTAQPSDTQDPDSEEVASGNPELESREERVSPETTTRPGAQPSAEDADSEEVALESPELESREVRTSPETTTRPNAEPTAEYFDPEEFAPRHREFWNWEMRTTPQTAS